MTNTLTVTPPITPAPSPQPSRKMRAIVATDFMKRDTDIDIEDANEVKDTLVQIADGAIVSRDMFL